MNNPVGAVLVPGAPTILYGYAAPAARLDEGAALGVGATSPAGVARVTISVFSPWLPAALHAALSGLARAGVALVQIDLRGNPGGEVRAAIEALGDLLAAGAVVAEMGTPSAIASRIAAAAMTSGCRSRSRSTARNGVPAAELFAGSLQAHRRALVIGARTYGKGASAVALGANLVDVARMLLPSGAGLDEGVTPERAR